MEKTTHIAVIPGIGFTHLVPILNFSKRLVQLHPHFHVTCIIPSIGSLPNASKAILQTLPPNINPILLPPVNLNDQPQGTRSVIKIHLAITRSMQSIHHTLKSITSNTPIVAMIIDSFAGEALGFAPEFNMLCYIYFPCSVTTLSTYLYMPKLDEEASCEYKDLPHPIQVPGCLPFHGRDLCTLARDRTGLPHELFLQRVKRISLVDGIFVNTFLEMETDPIRAFTDEERGYPPLYPVGPIVQTGTATADSTTGLECLTWLDKQQDGSVLYVCFGSGGTLSQEQMNELAHGLELSKHKFLWVVRAPSDKAGAGYLDGEKDVDPSEFLPSGFLERTKEQGMVVPSWAPQIEILGHGSVGGFLSHCGWNSTLESVVHGLPLITWPLFAEQRMNAVVMSEGLKVGVRARVSENGLVERVEIVEKIKCLMEEEEGREMRKRVKELKEAATNALKPDGASTKTLSQLAIKWKNLA
ncbi:hydroquinone glucosyltransferase-like [Vigna unguiculata]|uniref:hydroquinone glucosyltransferase-like n=1 Tax=Vigna unguiculata TaxID=3917 RepID=UPI0010165E00|nr:hydroquinone glucosyltransferase-like [Vigna unguiculata]